MAEAPLVRIAVLALMTHSHRNGLRARLMLGELAHQLSQKSVFPARALRADPCVFLGLEPGGVGGVALGRRV